MSKKSIQMGEIDIGRLRPNPWNTNSVGPENEEKLRASIARLGVFKPIICRELSDGTLEILGGEHRWQTAREMGHQTVPVVNLGAISDERAKEIGLVDNGRYGEDDTLALAELLKDLGNTDEILSFLPFSNDEMESIFSATSIALDDLDSSDEELPDLGSPATKPLKTHQIMRFKVPIEDSEWVQKAIEATMNAQGYLDDDAMSNAGNALVHLLKQVAK